jgi:hypothetical protein
MDFNYFDVKYTTEELTGSALSDKNSVDVFKRGGFNTSRYPLDLGNVDKNHFVFFSIFQQVRSSQQTRTGTLSIDENKKNSTDILRTRIVERGGPNMSASVVSGSEIAQKAISKGLSAFENNEAFKRLVKNNPKLAGIFTSGTKSFNENTKILPVTDGNLFNQVERIVDSIALYMPDTLAFSSSQSYSDVSMSDIGLGLVGASALSELMKSGTNMENIAKTIGANISPFAYAGIKKSLGTSGTSLFTAFTGQVMNPQLELLYSSPSFREFNLDFMFYPRSQEEAIEVYKIIELFNYHSAPEVKTGEAGFFMYPPSMFDIQFMYGGKENPNLPKISSCVLTRVDVDYAPNGFASYEDYNGPDASLGGTGTPVATRMTLHFKETQIQSKHTILYNNASRGDFKTGENPFTAAAPPATTQPKAAVSEAVSSGATPYAVPDGSRVTTTN